MVLVDIDLCEPIVPIDVPDTVDGLAVIARLDGRAIGFSMRSPLSGKVTADDLDRHLGATCGPELLSERLRQSVAGHETTRPLDPTTMTVAVCTKDRPAGLGRVLTSLGTLQSSADGWGVEIEILVIDNASDDPSVRAVAETHGARYVREERPGLDFARNRALAETSSRWLTFFDDDVIVDPTWLRGFVEGLVAHPDAAAFTGLVLPARLDTEAQVLFERRGGFRHGFVTRRMGRQHPVDPTYPAGAGSFGTGANMVVRVEAALAMGGFDPALDAGAPMPGGGDLDLWYRLVRAGEVVVYEPGCLVFHDHRESTDALARQFRDSWGRSFHAFIDKCYRTDPPMRSAHRRYLWRWYRAMLTDLARSARGRSSVPPRYLVAELRGAVQGMAGDYRRAVRRAEQVERDHR